VYPVVRYERLVKELGATASLYVFLKIALKRLFSNKSIHVKVTKVTIVIDQLLSFNP